MATRKRDTDKTICPEYIHQSIWERYQDSKDDQEQRAAFERVIFGDDRKNSQRAMKATWEAIEKARREKWVEFLEMDGGGVTEESEDFAKDCTYRAFAMQLGHIVHMKTEDFSKVQSPAARAGQLRGVVKEGRRFFNTLQAAGGVRDYGNFSLGDDGIALKERVLKELESPESKLFQAVEDARFKSAIKAFDREQAANGKGYLFSDAAAEQAEKRRILIADYEGSMMDGVIPLVIDYTIAYFRCSLIDHLSDALEEMEEELFWIFEEGHILPRGALTNTRRTYMIRYLAGCFFTLFFNRGDDVDRAGNVPKQLTSLVVMVI